MDWKFGNRRGNLEIANFGNPNQGYKSFGGTMRAPGSVDFSGILTGRNGTIGLGAASGSLVGPRAGLPPAGVMGNFGIAGFNWRANGIFGGGNTGYTPGNIAVDQ